jgi:hypothetical protein
MSPAILTLVAAVLAYDRVERASDACERKSGRNGRSEPRYAMSETSDEKDIVAEVVCCAPKVLKDQDPVRTRVRVRYGSNIAR